MTDRTIRKNPRGTRRVPPAAWRAVSDATEAAWLHGKEKLFQEREKLLTGIGLLMVNRRYNPGTMQTVYEAAGGHDGLLRLASAWHKRVLEDEVVSHAFSHGYHPQHTERLAAYWAEARVVQGKDLTFLHPTPRSPGLPQFPTAFAFEAIEPIPNKIGEVSFQRSL